MKGQTILMSLLLALLGTSQTSGRIITVDNDGPADYSTIQAAIDVSVNGDEVVVSEGTYSGAGNIEIDFGGRAIVLRSQSGPAQTVISVGSGHGFYFHSGEGANSILDGFTIANGYVGTGAGIFIENTSPTIKNCIIRDCTSTDYSWPGSGGSLSGSSAFFCYGGSSQIINCVICDNTGKDWGAGLSLIGSNQTVINCTITGNRTSTANAGVFTMGGNESRPVFISSIIWGNTRFDGHGSDIGTGYFDHCNIGHLPGGSETYTGLISADPLFTNGYHLMPNSPCIDAGTDGGVYTDIEGNPRPFDVQDIDNNGSLPDFDIGAYEYVDSDPPVADPNGPYTLYVGNTLALDASGSTDDENNIVSYMWDLDDDGVFETDAGTQAVFDVSYAYLESLGLLVGVDYNIHLKVTDGDEQADTDTTTLTVEPKPALVIAVDIKPTFCPNPLNVKSKGVLPVAILGSDSFDVTTIVISSLRLAGVAPLRDSYDDVAAPGLDVADCNCIEDGPDGFLDLALKFETQAIVQTLDEVEDGDVITLELTGVLFGETPIEGGDCILIRGRRKPFNKGDINKDGVVNILDFTIFTQNWLQSSIVDD